MNIPRVNSDNFLAVALIINRSRDGPAFVFHYPAHVQPVSGSSQGPELEDILLERLSQQGHGDVNEGPLPKQRNPDDHFVTDSGTQVVPWEHVAGFPARDLAGILTPSRVYHRRLFQLSLDPLYCVSYPVYVPKDGKWKRPKKPPKSSKGSKFGGDSVSASHEPDESVTGSKTAETPMDKFEEKEEEEEEKEKDEKRSSMTMFNLVFILNPKKNETKELVEVFYDKIVKKVAHALRTSQQHSEYVWKESKRILALKEKGREERKKMSVLWKEILENSSLALAIQELYEALSQNKIATLHLDTAGGSLTPSVQIPIPFYVDDLPHEEDKAKRGLWISTANSFISQEALDEPNFLNRTFSLLLTEDENKIISELKSDPDPMTKSLVDFTLLSKPTITFYQMSQGSNLAPAAVRDFAQHFIFWRRAIAAPPLHARDIYITSPNCDLTKLAQHSLEWQRSFPLAPPLPNFLAELSQSPRPYKQFSPSKAHRPTYLLMLAWLMRGGWVTQLCTFAYVVVWPEILYEVDYEIEAEELKAADEESRSEADGAPPRSSDSSEERCSGGDTAHVPTMTEQAAEKARLERIASKAHREAAEKATAHARKVVPVATQHPSVNDSPHLAGITPHVILDAKKATGKESRYLSAISRRFRDDKIKDAWQMLYKYFDGHYALERITLLEDLKRKEVWNLLAAMSEHLLCTRHW